MHKIIKLMLHGFKCMEGRTPYPLRMHPIIVLTTFHKKFWIKQTSCRMRSLKSPTSIS